MIKSAICEGVAVWSSQSQKLRLDTETGKVGGALAERGAEIETALRGALAKLGGKAPRCPSRPAMNKIAMWL